MTIRYATWVLSLSLFWAILCIREGFLSILTYAAEKFQRWARGYAIVGKKWRDGIAFCFSMKPYVCSYIIGVVSSICTFVGRTGTNAQAHTCLGGSDCEVQAGVPWAGSVDLNISPVGRKGNADPSAARILLFLCVCGYVFITTCPVGGDVSVVLSVVRLNRLWPRNGSTCSSRCT
jgi:hypothetical protein